MTVTPCTRIDEGFKAGRGAGKDRHGAFYLRTRHGEIAGMIGQALILLVGRVVLLIDDDEAQIAIGQENRRAGACNDTGAASGYFTPCPAALGRPDGRMPERWRHPKAVFKPRRNGLVRAISGSSTSTCASGSRRKSSAIASR